MESFADLVSDYEGFQTVVLRSGLPNGRYGSFFASFRPHCSGNASLDGLIGLPAPSRLHSGIPRLPSLHFVPFRAALR